VGCDRKSLDKQLIGCSCSSWSYFFGTGESHAVSHASWKTMLAPMIDNVVISEVDSLKYVVLSEVEKRVPYGELFGTTMFDAIAEVSYKPRSL
jgi:hypothetical protein